jgi:hypothetical protein
LHTDSAVILDSLNDLMSRSPQKQAARLHPEFIRSDTQYPCHGQTTIDFVERRNVLLTELAVK